MKRWIQSSLWATAGAIVASFALIATGSAEPLESGIVPVPYIIVCGPAEELEMALRANGEKIAARGVVESSRRTGPNAEIWINPQSHEWTMVFSDAAAGRSCMVAAGKELQVERPSPEAPSEKARTL